MVTGRGCGKVILVGEHAVVYGASAVAVALERGARAHATRLVRSPSVLRVAAWKVEVSPDDDNPLARAFAAVLPRRDEPVRVELETDLPPGGGLGCSAALGVATVRALHPGAPLELVRERAMDWERVFHGNPSGLDAEVSARGGCIWFKRGEGSQPIGLGAPLVLCVGTTGVPSSTKDMVERVAALRARDPRRVDGACDALGRLAALARDAIARGEVATLGAALHEAQVVLRTLDVSTADLDVACAVAESAGALGAKLTGAGGGGCVVALADGAAAGAEIVAAWKRSGFDGFVSEVALPEATSIPKEKAS